MTQTQVARSADPAPVKASLEEITGLRVEDVSQAIRQQGRIRAFLGNHLIVSMLGGLAFGLLATAVLRSRR